MKSLVDRRIDQNFQCLALLQVWLSSQRALNAGERAPLLNATGRSVMMERYMESAETVSVTGSNFYSIAAHTPINSDDDENSECDDSYTTKTMSPTSMVSPPISGPLCYVIQADQPCDFPGSVLSQLNSPC